MKQYILSFLVVILISFIMCLPVLAQTGMDTVKSGLNVSAGQAGLETQKTPISMATNIIAYALGFVGILVFINIIFAGFQWISSNGNEETISKAKERIKNSIIGLFIIVAAYFITSNIFTLISNAVV